MNALSNAELGIEHFFLNLTHHHPSVQQAVALLRNSITTIAHDIEAAGFPVVEKVVVDLATETASALADSTLTKAAAGKAAINTIKTAGTTLKDDTLRILATDLLTDVAALKPSA